MRTTPLQVLHRPTDRQARRDRHKQMDVIAIHRPSVDHHLMSYRSLTDQLAAPQADITTQNLVAIFRNPYDVIFAVPNRVTAAFVRFHTAILHGNRHNPMPLKGVGFPDPLSGTLKNEAAHDLTATLQLSTMTNGSLCDSFKHTGSRNLLCFRSSIHKFFQMKLEIGLPRQMCFPVPNRNLAF